MIITDIARSKIVRKRERRSVQMMIPLSWPSLVIDTTETPLIFAEGDVKTHNHEFIKVLDDLRKDVQNKGIDLTGCRHDYFERLRDKGKAAYNAVLSSEARRRIAELETQAGQRGLGLTFKTPRTYSLFWEMLYAGDPFNMDREQFWGFRYPLGRTYWNIDAPDRIRLQHGIFSAIHDGLTGSRQEVAQITQHLQWAGGLLGLQFASELLEHIIPAEGLSVEHILELFHSTEFEYGIVHFACHAENPEESGATEAYLSFTAHKNRLEMCLGKLLAWQEYGFVHRPFVFLNACSSATSGHLLQTLSFPTEMLNFGAGGVIATACTIPDNFASAFASELYKRLFGCEEDADLETSTSAPLRVAPSFSDIGEALLATRRYFLRRYNNPLGLAYGLYAVSNQQLRLLD
ncbi:MAG: CHAT domain-containing protein [Anaerolineae bacterium]|nr:CHAT domain-containing protein [Anaerolineae bacterium]